MAAGSAIEWTQATWNPVTGCTKISPGCKHCYAERMARRLEAMGQSNYRDGFRLTLQPRMLELPLRWRRPRTIFVNSMSDLFHRDVPLDYVERIFDVMGRASWHTFQDQCRCAGVAFFFKQWGGTRKIRSGRTLEGRTWDEMPSASVTVPAP